MKKYIAFAIGFTPFLFGALFDWILVNVFEESLPPLFIIGILALAVWFAFAYILCKRIECNTQTIVLLNLPAALVLILLGVQQFTSMWPNFIGLQTQRFFLPLLNVGATLGRWLPYSTLFSSACISFVLMAVVSYFGYRLIHNQ